MISHYDMGTGHPIDDDSITRPEIREPFEYAAATRLVTVAEANAIERNRLPAPAAVLSIPVDALLAHVGRSYCRY